jgi:Peptidase family M23
VRSLAGCLIACVTWGLLAPAVGAPAVRLIPPVDAAIARPFEAPSGPYGPGHRGIDYAVPTNTRVRAAAAGTVAFAGQAGGSLAVTVAHAGDVRTTYSVLSRLSVHAGETVQQGQWLGLSGVAHPGGDPGLHFGAKIAGAYVDPTTLFGPVDVTQALHLAPLAWQPVPQVARLLALRRTAGDYRRPCARPSSIAASLPPPDSNLAIAIAGLDSKTAGGVDADIFRYGPVMLGYRPRKVFFFSYRGTNGPHLHQPYRRSDTFGDLRVAARRLRRLMLILGRRFPGAKVDLFAHSQGGLVARLFLESQAAYWDPRMPRVAHLVTFATPQRGAPLAQMAEDLRSNDLGRKVLQAASHLAGSGLPVPDPQAPVISELAPGSPLLDGLARQDVSYGTQVLTLTTPFDALVPSDRADMRGELNRVVPPNGLFGHSAIVRSETARRMEYSFLRGGPIACRGWWDAHGTQIGAAIDWAERRLGRALTGGVARLASAVRWGSGFVRRF